ncbi:MAG: S9 family peptidase [Planctomycetes bacterium]|nr:S9 family peptidase [Planctomycetota bacterium]
MSIRACTLVATTVALVLPACRSTAKPPAAPRAAAEAAQPVTATGKRPLSIADFYLTKSVGAPAVSPDGRRLVFTVRHTDFAAEKAWTELWLVNSDGSGLRQLTASGNNDGEPSFSPDGRTLLFVSSRSGGSQLWTLALDGGEPRQLTKFEPGLSGPVWSPDGRWIACATEVWPECSIDAECNAKADADKDADKLEVYTSEELLYRHWTAWEDGKRTHIVLVDAKSGAVARDLTPGDFDAPPFSLGGDRGYAFSPDGSEVCFVSNRDANPAFSTNADLWTVAVESDGRAPRNLTNSNGGYDGAPLYSPDGRWIAFIRQASAGYESELKQLCVLERATGAVRELTSRAGFDDWVNDMRWRADSRALYFSADHRGRTPLFEVGIDGGKPVEVLTHAYLNGWEPLPQGGFAYSSRAIARPPELYRVDAPKAGPVQLTRFNQALVDAVDIRPAEELWIQGDGDYGVHTFVVKPHGFDPNKKYPLILNVHGGPQSQWSDAWRGDWQVYPAQGYVVAFCNPTGSSGYGQPFTDAIARDYGGRVYRDLMHVTDALAALPYVDAERMGAMGWSYGGYMMMWMNGQTDRFRCQAAMMGIFDLSQFYGATEELWFPTHDLGGAPWESPDYERFSPSNFVENFKTPSLVITGELDYRCPYTQSLAYYTALKSRGVPARLVVYPKAGHWPNWIEMAYYYNAHLDWFQRWLGGGKAPYSVDGWARGRR